MIEDPAPMDWLLERVDDEFDTYVREHYGDPRSAYRRWLDRDPHWHTKGAE